MDHLVTALWHIMGNWKFIVNQNRGRGRGRGRTSYLLSAKVGTGGSQRTLGCELNISRLVNYAGECKSSQEFLLKLLFIYPRSSLIKYESKLV